MIGCISRKFDAVCSFFMGAREIISMWEPAFERL